MSGFKLYEHRNRAHHALQNESLTSAHQDTLQTLFDYHDDFYTTETRREEKAQENALKAKKVHDSKEIQALKNQQLFNRFYILASRTIQRTYANTVVVVANTDSKSSLQTTPKSAHVPLTDKKKFKPDPLKYIHYTTAHLRKLTQIVYVNIDEYLDKGMEETHPIADLVARAVPADLKREDVQYRRYLLDLKQTLADEREAVCASMLERLQLAHRSYNLRYDDILRDHYLRQKDLGVQKEFKFLQNNPRFGLNKGLFEYIYCYIVQFASELIRGILGRISWLNGTLKIADGKLFAVPEGIDSSDVPTKRGWPEFLNVGTNLRYEVFSDWEKFANLGLCFNKIQDAVNAFAARNANDIQLNDKFAIYFAEIFNDICVLKQTLRMEIRGAQEKHNELWFFHGKSKHVLSQLIQGFNDQIQNVLQQELKFFESFVEKLNPEQLLNNPKLLNQINELREDLRRELKNSPSYDRFERADKQLQKKLTHIQVQRFIKTLKENRDLLPYWQRQRGRPFRAVDGDELDKCVSMCSEAMLPNIKQAQIEIAAFLKGKVLLTAVQLKQHLRTLMVCDEPNPAPQLDGQVDELVTFLVVRYVQNSLHFEVFGAGDTYLQFLRDYDSTHKSHCATTYTTGMGQDALGALQHVQSIFTSKPQLEIDEKGGGEPLYSYTHQTRATKHTRTHVLSFVHTLVLASFQQGPNFAGEVFKVFERFVAKFNGAHSNLACIFYAYGNLDFISTHATCRFEYLIKGQQFSQLCMELREPTALEQRKRLHEILSQLLSQFISQAKEAELITLYHTLAKEGELSMSYKNDIEKRLDMLRMDRLLQLVRAQTPIAELHSFVAAFEKSGIAFPATNQSVANDLISQEIEKCQMDDGLWNPQYAWLIEIYGTYDDARKYHHKWLARMLFDRAFSQTKKIHDLVDYPAPTANLAPPLILDVLNFYGIEPENLVAIFKVLKDALIQYLQEPLASTAMSHQLIGDLLQDGVEVFLDDATTKELQFLRQQYQSFTKMRREQHDTYQQLQTILENLGNGEFRQVFTTMNPLYSKYAMLKVGHEEKAQLTHLFTTTVLQLKLIFQARIQRAYQNPTHTDFTSIALLLSDMSDDLILKLPQTSQVNMVHDQTVHLLQFVCRYEHRTQLINFPLERISKAIDEFTRTKSDDVLRGLCQPILLCLFLLNAYGAQTAELLHRIQTEVLPHAKAPFSNLLSAVILVHDNPGHESIEAWLLIQRSLPNALLDTKREDVVITVMPERDTRLTPNPGATIGTLASSTSQSVDERQVRIINSFRTLFGSIQQAFNQLDIAALFQNLSSTYQGFLRVAEGKLTSNAQRVLGEHLGELTSLYQKYKSPSDAKLSAIQSANAKALIQFYESNQQLKQLQTQLVPTPNAATAPQMTVAMV